MDDEVVFPRLLETLRDSPLWQWGQPPTLWAVVSEDPVVILPAFMVDSIEGLRGLAQHWMSDHENDVPATALALTVEGESHGLEVRDCVVTHKDGGMFWARHVKDTGLISPIAVTGNIAGDGLPVEVMREVGASAWP